MNDKTFVQRVQENFGFLESEFGFTRTIATNSDQLIQTDGAVEYKSASTAILIDSERASAALRIYRIMDGPKYYLTPIDIDEFLNTSPSEKELLLSTDPENLRQASELFGRKNLLTQPDWKSEDESPEGRLELRLARYADWLKKNADLCLRGFFSLWPDFYEYKIHRTRADQLRRGRNEFQYVSVQDPDGNERLIQQSMFKDQLDHIEKLKRELRK